MTKRIALLGLAMGLAGAIAGTIVSGPHFRTTSPSREVAEALGKPTPPSPWWLTFEEELPAGCPSAVSQALVWLTVRGRDDGSWGEGPAELEGLPLGRSGLSALALLPILGAGFTPLSRDVWRIDGGDWKIGSAIRNGLMWLVRDQRDDGVFRSMGGGGLDQALGAFALSQAYGMTGSPALKSPAQRAVDALIRRQTPEGVREPAGPATWTLLALLSARSSELDLPPGVLDRTLRSNAAGGHPGHALALILLRSNAAGEAFRLREEAGIQEASNLPWWYVASLAVWACDGNPEGRPWGFTPGPEWTAWRPILRERLVPLLRPEASFPGRTLEESIVRTSLLQMTLEVYYGYGDALRPR